MRFSDVMPPLDWQAIYDLQRYSDAPLTTDEAYALLKAKREAGE
jgi:hypothetical protein